MPWYLISSLRKCLKHTRWCFFPFSKYQSSSLAFVIQINRRSLFFGKEKNPFSPKLAHTMHVLAILNTKYYICLSAYTVTIMIKPREKHLPKFTKGISNSATRRLLLAKRVKRIYCLWLNLDLELHTEIWQK